MSQPSPTCLVMLAKHWQPGKVKTRLAGTLGQSHAAMVHALFVCALVERLQSAADRRILAYTPAAAERAFAGVVKGRWELAPQAEGDLGLRMERLLEAGLAVAARVVVIGSDSPDLPRQYLDEAFAALASRQVVLSPSFDGGYYLVGAAGRVPPIFRGIDWSTPQVWQQTVARLAEAGIAWHELPGWYDVDDGTALQALAQRLDGEQADARLVQLRRELHTLLGAEMRRSSKSKR